MLSRLAVLKCTVFDSMPCSFALKFKMLCLSFKCFNLDSVKNLAYRSSWYFKSAKLTISKHLSWQASSITGGANPASLASSHRAAHKHQRSPATKPSKPYSGRGVLKSFPCAWEKAKNSSVTCVHTVWLPMSSTPVSQQPVRVKPVSGFMLQTCNAVPKTLRVISIFT